VAFDRQPELKGVLIELRPLRADDFDALFAAGSDPLIWEQHPAKTRYERDEFTKFFNDALGSGGALVALDAKDGTVIGSSRYYGYDEANSEVEIGWTFLARSHWGGKYNGEMKQLMLAHAFKFVRNVVFLIGPQNIRSQKAVGKIGGIQIANRLNSLGADCVVYRITDPAAIS
jgi:RimJ/RimL family protein N-acetyltransferase